MRFSWLIPLLAVASPILASAKNEESVSSEASSEPKATVFNGQEVPPLMQMSGEKLNDEIAKGYWLVEFYSPYCHHCAALAPIWQTLYEFYYTLKPMQSASPSTESDGLNSFTRYYNFKFAKVDCVAFGTACSEKKVESFPTIILFKDGKEVKNSVGTKDLPTLSKWVEEILESIRPGSRPKEGPKLPEVGDHSVDPAGKPEKPESKDKDPAAGAAAASKHNSLASKATATVKEQPRKPKHTVKSSGTSVPLTAESFQKLVTTTRDPWFVKFYAPWCHHCQGMAPNWAEMAREMKGDLNVGEVNCDVERRLCKDARVKGYPTVLFFRGGERVEYDGLRGVGDLISFAKNAIDVGLGVDDVDFAAFKAMEETEEVIFLYFYDHATTSEDFAALEHLTLSLIGHGKLVKTKDPKLAERFKISTWPRLMVSRDGKPSYYPHIAPKDMRDFRAILGWMKSVWLPLVPELTASNAREIMTNSIAVLGLLSRDRSDEFVIAKREIKNAALEWIGRVSHQRKLEREELRDSKQLRMEEAEDRGDERALRAARNTRIVLEEGREVKFAWVDSVFWERWIRTTFGVDVADGERVVIVDQDNHRYWDTTMTGNPIVPSRTSILETIPRVLANPPKIPPKSTTSTIGTIFYSLRSTWRRHPWLSIIMLIGFSFSATVLVRRYRKHQWGSGGFFNLDGEKGAFGMASGKVD